MKHVIIAAAAVLALSACSTHSEKMMSEAPAAEMAFDADGALKTAIQSGKRAENLAPGASGAARLEAAADAAAKSRAAADSLRDYNPGLKATQAAAAAEAAEKAVAEARKRLADAALAAAAGKAAAAAPKAEPAPAAPMPAHAYCTDAGGVVDHVMGQDMKDIVTCKIGEDHYLIDTFYRYNMASKVKK